MAAVFRNPLPPPPKPPLLPFPSAARIAATMGLTATDAARRASDIQMPIVSIAFHQRQRGVAVLVIRVMQAALRGCPIRPNFRNCRICFPEIRQAKASCDHAFAPCSGRAFAHRRHSADIVLIAAAHRPDSRKSAASVSAHDKNSL